MFSNWKSLLVISIIFLLCIVGLTIFTEQWVILSLGVGFLFGFAMQKGDLCGSSAMSEVILMKDGSKLFGVWITILTSMVLFAIFESLGIIQLAPKKLIWLSALVGGIIFGVGTVLGGGCISGCMYKGATGNINSIAALLTIPIGVSLVDFGPLKPLNHTLLSYVINGDDGKAITLHSLLGIPYWTLVLFFLLLTVVLVVIKQKKRKKNENIKHEKQGFGRIFSKSWKPWQAGIAIGVIAMLAWLSSLPVGRNYPLGVTHGLNHTYQAFIENNVKFIYEKPQPAKPAAVDTSTSSLTAAAPQGITPPAEAPKPEPRKLNVWLMLLSIGFILGAFVSGRMSGQAKLLPKEPSQTLIAMFGGLLIGVGAGIATGCIVGNILSAWAMFSVGMFIFGIATLLANWATTFFYLIGGNLINILKRDS
jgi:hypothetical protein